MFWLDHSKEGLLRNWRDGERGSLHLCCGVTRTRGSCCRLGHTAVAAVSVAELAEAIKRVALVADDVQR